MASYDSRKITEINFCYVSLCMNFDYGNENFCERSLRMNFEKILKSHDFFISMLNGLNVNFFVNHQKIWNLTF